MEDITKDHALEQQRAEYEEKINSLRLNFAVEIALLKAGAKNVTAAKALINMNELTYDENKGAVGINEQIEALKADEATAFLFEDKGKDSGFVPRDGKIVPEDMGKMTYSRFCEIYGN